jgi:hypothetical protein
MANKDVGEEVDSPTASAQWSSIADLLGSSKALRHVVPGTRKERAEQDT